MKYAKITANIVEQVQPYAQDGFIEVPDSTMPGMVYDDVLKIFSNPPVIPVIPSSVTRVQAMKAMKQTGTLWVDFNALLASNQDAKDEWDLATALERDNPFTLQLAPALGLTSAQLDDLFRLASTL